MFQGTSEGTNVYSQTCNFIQSSYQDYPGYKEPEHYSMSDMYGDDIPTGNNSEYWPSPCDYIKEKPALHWVFFLTILSLTVMCYISNSLVIFIITVEKTLRTPTFYALRSLSIVSMIYITQLFNGPATCMLNNPFNIDESSSEKCGWLVHVNICLRQITMVHLSLIAAIRVYLITFPLNSMVHLTVSKVRYTSVGIWVGFALIEIVIYFLDVRTCVSSTFTKYQKYYLIEFCFVLILVIALYLSADIIMRIKSRQSRALRSAVQKRQTRAASLTLISMVAVFCPIKIAHLIINSFCFWEDQDIVRIVGMSVEFFIFGVNPFILVLGLKYIRTSIKQRLCEFLVVKPKTKPKCGQSISKTLELRLSSETQKHSNNFK